jgi:hypothetical protein
MNNFSIIECSHSSLFNSNYINLDRSVGKVTWISAGLGSIPGRGRKFSVRRRAQAGSRAYSPSYPMITGLKRPKREADHAHQSDAEHNTWSWNFTPLNCAQAKKQLYLLIYITDVKYLIFITLTPAGYKNMKPEL